MPAPDRSRAMEHIVVALFENRSLDNVLGHLYGPGDGKDFDGVIGKDLSNPIPAWAEHGADRQVVPYTVATDMDSRHRGMRRRRGRRRRWTGSSPTTSPPSPERWAASPAPRPAPVRRSWDPGPGPPAARAQVRPDHRRILHRRSPACAGSPGIHGPVPAVVVVIRHHCIQGFRGVTSPECSERAVQPSRSPSSRARATAWLRLAAPSFR